MMKRLLYIILLFIPGIASAQLHALSDQYIFNGLAINPAYAGSNGALSASIMYRNQWVGFEGAPKTLTAAIHAPLRNNLIGLGLLIVNDQIGISNETSISGNYAYIIEMGRGKLALGVGLGITLLNAQWEDLKAISLDDFELFNSDTKATNPNFSTGVYYHDKKFFLGISIPFFLSYEFNASTEKLELKNDISEYNFYLSTGYVLEMNSDVKFFPSLMTKYHPGNALQVDVIPQFIFRDRLWVGLSYRSLDALIGILQLQVYDQLRIAYSYDYDIGKTGRYNSGSHEVMLNFVFSVNSKVIGPTRF